MERAVISDYIKRVAAQAHAVTCVLDFPGNKSQLPESKDSGRIVPPQRAALATCPRQLGLN